MVIKPRLLLQHVQWVCATTLLAIIVSLAIMASSTPKGHFVADTESLAKGPREYRYISQPRDTGREMHLTAKLKPSQDELHISVALQKKGLVRRIKSTVDVKDLSIIELRDYTISPSRVKVIKAERAREHIYLTQLNTNQPERVSLHVGSASVYDPLLLPFLFCWAQKGGLPGTVLVVDSVSQRLLNCKIKSCALSASDFRVLFSTDQFRVQADYKDDEQKRCVPKLIQIENVGSSSRVFEYVGHQ